MASIIIIMIMIGVAIICLFVGISALAYENRKGKANARLQEKDKWLFADMGNSMYEAFFRDRNEHDLASKLGINVEKYYHNCELLKIEPNVKQLITYYIYGVLALIVCAVLCAFVSYYFIVVGVFLFMYFAIFKQKSYDKKADAMREKLMGELPRFLDLLQSEIDIGMPIENAIYLLCERMPETLLAKEFMSALSDMELGLSGWQEALTKLAEKYDVETFSDFVLNITTAYTRGVSISHVIRQKNVEIKQIHLLTVKEKAGKATNTILLPITAFQFAPMMIFLIFPALLQVTSGLA